MIRSSAVSRAEEIKNEELQFNMPAYDVPIRIPPEFAISESTKALLFSRFIELTGQRETLQAKRFLFMLRNDGQDFGLLEGNKKIEDAKRSNLTLNNNQDSVPIDNEKKDTKGDTPAMPKEDQNNLEVPVPNDKFNPTIAVEIQTSTSTAITTKEVTSSEENLESLESYDSVVIPEIADVALPREEKVDMYWKAIYLISTDIINGPRKIDQTYWRDNVFVPLVWHFRHAVDPYFKWFPLKDTTGGSLVLNKDRRAGAVLFECITGDPTQFHSLDAFCAVQADLEHRHKRWSNEKHRVVAVVMGQDTCATALYAIMTPQNKIETKMIAQWNLKKFEEVFSFAVFLSSLVPFLHEEEAKCPKRTKKRRLDSVDNVEEPDKKRQKIDLTESGDAWMEYLVLTQIKINIATITPLLDDRELNPEQLFQTQVTFKTRRLSPIVALANLQGYLGVPKLLAYSCFQQGYHYYLMDTTDFTEWPQPPMSLKAMLAQYLTALKEFHKQCFALGTKIRIRWQGQEIKFVDWESCGFRGDTDNCKHSFYPADSCLDMEKVGSTIIKWSEKFQSEEFLPLAKVLMHSIPFLRFSPEFALKVLDAPHLANLTQLCPPVFSLEMARRLCDEHILISVVQHRLKETAKLKTKLALKIEWLDQITKIVQRGKFTDTNGNEVQVVGKTLISKGYFGLDLWGIGLEFAASQWFSGENFLPRLLDFEINQTIEEGEKPKISSVKLVFQHYNKEPKLQNILRTAKQLLTAVQTIHKKRLVHSDIAPANVMWDDNDDVVLIDFGSSFWFNHFDAPSGWITYAEQRPYGHPGCMPRDQVRYPVTDVFSAGRTIEFFANEWNQMTPELKGLIQAMTFDQWYRRISVDEALKRLMQIQFENEIAQTNQTNESNRMKD